MVYKLKNLVWLNLTSACLAVASVGAFAQGKFYRFVNDEGTKVISSSIPSKYVGGGYEILSSNGQIIKVIPPEPKAEEKERVDRERALMAQYKILARRYSSVRDISAARDRRLAHLDANIAILRGNISSFKSQIEEMMSEAAKFERAGKKIPAHIFKSIDDLRAETKGAEDVLRGRLEQHKIIYDKYESNMALFEQGKKLQARR